MPWEARHDRLHRSEAGAGRARQGRHSMTDCTVQSDAAPIPAPGHMGVDYEQRVDFDRLRRYRLQRAKEALAGSECGAFLLFDFYNIRHTTPTWIGGAIGDKMTR